METGTLKQAAEYLDINYDTLRKYASQHSETFPAALALNTRGRGLVWDMDEIRTWWEVYLSERKSGGAQHHVDGSARARLGHKFRHVRSLNRCSDCSRQFAPGESVWELRSDDELTILCDTCNTAREAVVVDTSEAQE